MSHPGNINLQQLMLEAYRAIGDPDAIYGCGAGRLADTNSRSGLGFNESKLKGYLVKSNALFSSFAIFVS